MKKITSCIRIPSFVRKGLLLCSLLAIVSGTSFAGLGDHSSEGILDKKITISIKNENFKAALREISEAAGVRFSYTRNTLPEKEKVSVIANAETLNSLFSSLFGPYDIRYEAVGNQIILKRKELPGLLINQQKASLPHNFIPIRGTVKDAEGRPIAGVSVVVRSTGNGTSTNTGGEFTIDASVGDTLDFSIVGYQPVSVTIRNSAAIDVQLQTEISGLEEVVVVGYGTQKKANLTGATDRITSEQLESRPINNVGSGLQGLIPNLNVTTASGRPNTASSLNIRGAVSINGGEPLILVDNIPVTQAEAARLNPLDVESVTVLKDAASAAIYGARASFGVILITTKSGKGSELAVNVNAYTAYRTVGKLPEIVTDPYTVALLKNEAGFPLYNPVFSPFFVEQAKKRSEDPSLPAVIVDPNDPESYLYIGETDWLREGYNKTAPSYNVNMNISQKAEKVGYYFSADYYRQDGMIRFNPDIYERYNMRGKVDFNATDWLTFSNNTSFANVLYNSPTYLDGNYFWNLNRQAPFDVPKNPDGTWTSAGAAQLGSIQEGGRSDSKLNDFQSTFSFNASIIKGLWNLRGDATFRRTSSLARRYEIPVPYTDGPNGPVKYSGGLTGSASDNNSSRVYNVYNLYTDANKNFGNHFIGVLAGFNQEESETISNSVNRTGLISYNLPTLNLSTGTTTASESIREWAVRGFFGRVNYNFKERYLLELNGRYDGSSRFPAHDRWGFFPSASAGWVLSDEAFFTSVKDAVKLNFLKFRASYGSLGNQAGVSEYGYIPSMSITQQIGQILGSERPSAVTPPGAVAASYTWEKINTINFGADLLFFNNRLEINLDKYTRKVEGMLVPGKTLPNVFGTGVPRVNAGDMETKGYEVKVSWRDRGELAGSDFVYNITVGLADSRAYITRFDNPTNSINNYYVGMELGEIWGLDVDGFFQSEDEVKGKDYSGVGTDDQGYQFYVGDIKYSDRNQDNKLNFGKKTLDDPGDYYIIGNNSSRLPYSIDASGGWKGFDLRVFFQGIGKRDWYPGGSNIYFWGIYAQPWTNVTKQNLDHWTPENPNAYFPRIKAYAAEDNGAELGIPNTRYMQDASYLRCKNITVGYTLPQHLLQRIKFNKIRLYVSAENLFEFSNLKVNLDPEGLSGDIYPFQRTYSFGLNFNF